MRSLSDETGGIVARLVWLLVLISVTAGGALYVYGKHQRPLTFEGLHATTQDGDRDPRTVDFTSGATVAIATVVRNDGRLPVTLEGLSVDPPGRTDPLVPVGLGLGDGRTPVPSTDSFAPPDLEPSSAIGVVITFGVNPNLACERFTSSREQRSLPPVELRFSSYGVESVQSVALPEGAPSVERLTPATCRSAVD